MTEAERQQILDGAKEFFKTENCSKPYFKHKKTNIT